MEKEDFKILSHLWNSYFCQEIYTVHDQRNGAINLFREFFQSDVGISMLGSLNIAVDKYLYFDVQQLKATLPFPDFESTLINRPIEVMCCIGLALSLIVNRKNPYLPNIISIKCRFYNLTSSISYGDLKSSTVGQLVSLEGHVVKASNCHLLVERASFICPKCAQPTWVTFEDGVYMPPNTCSTPKCNNKYLEFDRSSVVTTDYQRIKLTEVDSQTDDTSRMPRSFEVEVRDSLVNVCIPGDLVCVVGFVKTSQVDAPKVMRWGGGGGGRGGGGGATYKESGLHQLYLLVNSMVCVQTSGDRTGASGAGAGAIIASNKVILDKIPRTIGTPLGGTSSSSSSNNNSGSTSGYGGSNTGSLTASGVKDASFSTSELAFIRQLALSPQCFAILVNSLCGSIFGHELVKAGLLLALFGGTKHDSNGSGGGGGGGSGGRSDQSNLSGGGFGTDNSAHGPSSSHSGAFHIRSDIHVLVVGDPGLGKSQMLRAAANIAPRAVFVCGNTTTTAGLTVSISREGGGKNGGGDLAIEAGALVLADNGVCCIDELDKITCDHHALLEAMEQQSISIAKSGVVTSLKSRTTVLAAANPVGGHYNRKKTVSENLKMNAALLSRFDLIFILLDRPDENRDRLISEHIMKTHFIANNNHSGNGGGGPSGNGPSGGGYSQYPATQHGSNTGGGGDYDVTLAQRLRRQIRDMSQRTPVPQHQSQHQHYQHNSQFSQFNGSQTSSFTVAGTGSNSPPMTSVPHNLMTRYIEYAKRYVHPRLTKPAAKVLQRLYLTMRSEASLGQSMPVTTRHLESLIRLSQARARIELREEVTEEDANDVVQLLQESLLDVFTSETGEIDCGRKGGMGLAKQVKALVKVLTKESSRRDSANIFTRNEIAEVCAKLKLERDPDSLIDVMRTECYLLLKGPRLYQLQTY